MRLDQIDWEDPSLYRRIILKWIFKNRMWGRGLNWAG